MNFETTDFTWFGHIQHGICVGPPTADHVVLAFLFNGILLGTCLGSSLTHWAHDFPVYLYLCSTLRYLKGGVPLSFSVYKDINLHFQQARALPTLYANLLLKA